MIPRSSRRQVVFKALGNPMEFVNPVLLLVVIGVACFGICAWRSPPFLRRMAAHLLTRADVIDISRQEHKQRIEFWCGELRLHRQPLGKEASHEPPPAVPTRRPPLVRENGVPQAH